MSRNENIDPAQNASNKEKAAAFEWLRKVALSDSSGAEHAAVMMYEVERLTRARGER